MAHVNYKYPISCTLFSNMIVPHDSQLVVSDKSAYKGHSKENRINCIKFVI